ncbi:MAG: carboxymuconolactone decarboxylase family protein [Perlucidibaca sp.]
MTTGELQPPGGWIITATPRISPPPSAERGLLFRAAAQASRLFGRQQVPDVITVLHINPRLFWGWLYFASRLMPYGRLPARTREKLILRTAWNCRSRYEWGQHVEIALRTGVTDAEIVAITGAAEHLPDAQERAMIQACDELCRQQHVSDQTWAALTPMLDEKQLLELMLLVGHYQMLAGLLNSAGLSLEPAIETALQDFHRRIAG